MSYQPYVTTGGNNKNNNNNNNKHKNNQQRPQQRQPQSNSCATNSAGAYAPATAGGYGGTAGVNSCASSRPAATTPSSTSDGNSYGTSYGASAPRTATTTTTSQAMPDFSRALDLPPPTAPPAAPTAPSYGTSSVNSSRTPTYASATPVYGNAIPTNQSSTSSGGYTPAVAIPVTNTGGGGGSGSAGYYGDSKLGVGHVTSSALNSSTYTGGPTGGLISESNPTICHRVDYEIKGHEMQILEIELDPSETVIAQVGVMLYLDEGIDFKTEFVDGSTPKEGFFKKLLNAGGRLLMGESLFISHFTNMGQRKARAAFAAPFPGTIIPLNLANLNGKVIVQKGGFLCAAKGTKISIHFNKNIGSGMFGGEGFILQKLEGDGMAFVHAGGTVIKRELRGEKLRIDTGCVVGFTEGINCDIQFAPGLKFGGKFGGEGLFLATLQGTGTIWMQSLPFSRLAGQIIQSTPLIGGSQARIGLD